MLADASAVLLLFVDAEPDVADKSAETVQDVVDAVNDNVDVEDKSMMLDPTG